MQSNSQSSSHATVTAHLCQCHHAIIPDVVGAQLQAAELGALSYQPSQRTCTRITKPAQQAAQYATSTSCHKQQKVFLYLKSHA
jgi:hypothetical protein